MKRYITLLILLMLCSATRAREVLPLNEGWRFFFKSENTSDNARVVTLPHTWNTDPRAAGLWLETTGNYGNDLFIPADWSAKRLFVKFYGAQNSADVFVNGFLAGSHRGGAAAFTFEITDKVKFGTENSLLVVVSNSFRNDVLPTSTDINLYGGLYREAELIVTDKTAVSPLYFSSDGVLVRQTAVGKDKAEGEVEVHLTAAGDHTCTLTVEIEAPDGRVVFSKRQKVRIDGKPVAVPFAIENPRLWSTSAPALYTVTASVDDDGAKDRVSVRTGFRSVKVTSQGGLAINDSRVQIHGVAMHHDNTLSGGTLIGADYDADLQQVRALGANAIRSAVMPHGQYLYDRCDEQGLLVWVDSPLQRANFLGDIAYYATPQFEQNGMQQLQEIVAQNYNHPSVVMWGIFSQLLTRGDDAAAYVRKLNDAAKAMDPTRPTVACSDQNGAINFITDLIVWRQDVGWAKGSAADLAIWREQLRKNWAHMRSAVTYGGAGFIGQKSYSAQGTPNPGLTPEERQTRFHEEYAKNLQGEQQFWGIWIGNMFDYGSSRQPYGVNGSGLVTIDRRDYKDAYYLYKAMWNKSEKTLHIAEKRLTLRDGELQTFRVYSSVGAPVLMIGADTLAVTEYAPCQYRADSVAVSGSVVLKASAGDLRDSASIRVGSAPKPKSLLDLRRTIGRQPTN